MDIKKILSLLEDAANQLEAARALVDAEDVKPPREALELAEKGVCLSCLKKYSDKNEKIVRGLHASCWHVISKALKRNELSELKLIRGGKLLPAQPGGRKAAPLPSDVKLIGGLREVDPQPAETKPDLRKDLKPKKRIPK